MNKKPTSVRLTGPAVRRIKSMVRRTKFSQSEIINSLIVKYGARHETALVNLKKLMLK